MDETGWSKLNEGWDGGTIDVDELVANLKTVARNSGVTIAMAVALLYAPLILLHVGVALLVAIAAFAPSITGVAAMSGMVVGVLAIFINLGILILTYALYRPLQQQCFEGKDFVPGALEALKAAWEVVPKVALTALMLFAALAVGMLACGVGVLVAAFFFVQAPYLAATTELAPAQCMRRSYELNKRYVMPVAIGFAVVFVGTGIIAAVGGGVAALVGFLVGLAFAPLGEAVTTIGIDLLSILMATLGLIAFGTVFATIQSIERGVPFVQD